MPKYKQLEPMTHGDIIAKIVSENHGALTHGFHKQAWSYFAESVPFEVEYDELNAAWFKSIMPLTPDAYAIEPLARKIILFEVEITSRLTPKKLNTLAHFMVDMVLYGWSVTLIRVDEYGRFQKERLERFVTTVPKEWEKQFQLTA